MSVSPSQAGKSFVPLENSEWESLCFNIKKSMTGTEEEKDNILRKRLLKFFHSFSLERNRYYVQRRQVSLDHGTSMQISNNSILMYGIDFLPQSKIEQYFYPFEVAVEYYDDSHCSVTFLNYRQLLEALYRRLKKPLSLSIELFIKYMTQNQIKKLEWMELMPYFELCFERVLWFRFLTTQDYASKNEVGKTAVHQTYIIAKNNFFKQALSSISANQGKSYKKSRDNSIQRSRSKNRQWLSERSRSRDQKNDQNINNNQICKSDKCKCLSQKLKKFFKSDHQCHRECQGIKKSKKDQMFQSYNQIVRRSINSKSGLIQKVSQQGPGLRLNNDKRHIHQNKANKTRNERRQSFNMNMREMEDKDLSEDSMIRSLVSELQKYKFDQQQVIFDARLKQIQKQHQSLAKMKNHHNNEEVEQSVFQIIEQF